MSDLDLEAIEERAEFLLSGIHDVNLDDIDNLITEVRRLRAAIAEADQLHSPRHDYGGTRVCDHCEDAYRDAQVRWPCPTHRALHPEDAS